jgi:signal transduction histidine kinase
MLNGGGLRDVTKLHGKNGDLKDLNAQDEMASDLHALFIQNVSHELRTPLSIILGYAELLNGEGMGELNESQRQAVNKILDHASDMRALIGRIDTLMEVRAGRMLAVPIKVDDALRNTLQKGREAAESAGLGWQSTIQEQLPFLSGDPQHLERALDCLIDNAIKFTPEGGEVRVEVRTEGENILIGVSDTGIGIEPDKLSHIFEDFYQADPSATRRHRGIGLGLTVTNAVTQALKGRIEVESVPGQGSTFTLVLPELPLSMAITCALEDEEVLLYI